MQRRRFIQGVTATALIPVFATAARAKVVNANAMQYAVARNAITGGKDVIKSDNIKIKVPEIAENGAVIPVKVSVTSTMTKTEYVKSIHILATKNSNVRCADVFFTLQNPKAYFSTRIKLGKTQEVEAIAALSDGTFISASQQVKVTIGGCG